jgi:protein-tyrosine-phosphatase
LKEKWQYLARLGMSRLRQMQTARASYLENRMLESSPVFFDYPNPRTNVFVMMRFQDTPQQAAILQTLTEELSHYGLHLLRADQKAYTDSLWANVKAYIHACSLGIAVFEQINDRDFNPNVSLELGYMLAQQKPVALLKEQRLAALPTDLLGHLYKPFDAFNIEATLRPNIKEWLRDVGVAKGPNERLLVYVSKGGTCRCAMAKIITEQALRGRTLPYRLRVESVAYDFGGTNEASHGARRVIYGHYEADLLKEHRVLRRNPGLLADADLILVMDEHMKQGLPPTKTHLFNEFFGASGNVVNPWPDGNTPEVITRYRDCFNHLRQQIEPNMDKILSSLEKAP